MAKIFLTGPDGKRVGPFRTREDAKKHSDTAWPGVPEDDREDDPAAFDMEFVGRKAR